MALYENGRCHRIVLTLSALLIMTAFGPAIAQHTDPHVSGSTLQSPQQPAAAAPPTPAEGEASTPPSDARQPSDPGCKLQNPTKLDLIV